MKKFLALVFFITYSIYSFACTTFLISKNGQHVFGRNYDWITNSGMVMVNTRGLKKTAKNPGNEKQANWMSRYGSITFNQYGKEFPTGGMNEKGLVVELMWLNEAKYPDEDTRAVLNELQWIQYQLDCSGTIEDVIASDNDIRITNNNTAPLHYLVADASGNAATIEFLNGKMIVHKGKNLPYAALTNSIYSDALNKTKTETGANNPKYFDNSLGRFATVCSMIEKVQNVDPKVSLVDYSFDILKQVSQGSYTKWSIVYDISNRQIHFITDNYHQRRSFSFDKFEFSCTEAPLAFNLQQNKPGDISSYFKPLDFNTNKALIEQSVKESRSQVDISPSYVSAAINHFYDGRCIF